MEQKNNNDLEPKTFSGLILEPSSITSANSVEIEGLIAKYPYSQLLRSFYLRSIVDSKSDAFERELIKAALFSTNGATLRTIIEDPESLNSKSNKTVPIESNVEGISEANPTEGAIASADSEIIGSEEILEPEALIDSVLDRGGHVNEALENETESNRIEQTVAEEHAESEIGNILATESENSIIEVVPENDVRSAAAELDEKDEDLAGNLIESLVNDDDSQSSKSTTELDELDLLIKQNAASADFLKVDEELESVLDRTENVFTPEPDIAQNITHNAVLEDQQKISRYNDDKMPYSFLWWLNKTRKEHIDNYQPYVSFHLDTSQSIKRNSVDQLSTQIMENIFHLQSPVDELKNAPKTVPFQVKRKEDFIVEKFIKEEPQIKPPNSEKLDNENKARKSAEDPNDLVSETLAIIYTDQMLFHKAIETYRKLSLKFPEKTTYFADQILELEKKLN